LFVALVGLLVGVMLFAGSYFVVKFVKAERAERQTAQTDAGLGANAPDGTGPGESGPANPSAGSGTGSGTGSGANPSAVPGAIQVPNVIGVSAATATDELRKLGIKQIQLASNTPGGKPADNPADWTVIKQSVGPGTRVGAETVVVLTCSMGY
jgi:hypothetical protein